VTVIAFPALVVVAENALTVHNLVYGSKADAFNASTVAIA